MKQNLTIAVIGAGEAALPILQKAREINVKTIAFGRADSMAKGYADVFVNADIFDYPFIIGVCKEQRVNGVIASSEMSTEVAAYVAHELALPGNDVEHGFAGRNKYIMRARVSSLHSIRQPRFSLYNDCSSYSFPVVVKSVDSCGKRGIGIAYNIDDLKIRVQESKNSSSNGEVLIEEYLEGGQEYSIECLSNGKGNHYVIQYTEKESSGPPHFVEIAHHQPANLSDSIKAKIDKAAWDVLEVLGLNYGMAHLEIKIIDNELYFIEVGARGGGDHISDILTPLSTGFDYYKAAIECHLGIYQPKSISNKAFTGIYFHSKQNERLRPLFEKARTAEWCIKNTVVKDDFDDATGNVGASNSGYIIYCADKRITI